MQIQSQFYAVFSDQIYHLLSAPERQISRCRSQQEHDSNHSWLQPRPIITFGDFFSCLSRQAWWFLTSAIVIILDATSPSNGLISFRCITIIKAVPVYSIVVYTLICTCGYPLNVISLTFSPFVVQTYWIVAPNRCWDASPRQQQKQSQMLLQWFPPSVFGSMYLFISSIFMIILNYTRRGFFHLQTRKILRCQNIYALCFWLLILSMLSGT